MVFVRFCFQVTTFRMKVIQDVEFFYFFKNFSYKQVGIFETKSFYTIFMNRNQVFINLFTNDYL